jgi:heat shock protein HslJ
MGRVLPSARYVSVFVLCFALLAKVNAMDLGELKGRWVLEAIDGKDIASGGAEIYFQITEQSISGYDGCNRFGGSITDPSAMRKTQRACPPETTLLPLNLSDPAPQLSRATMRGGKLFLPLRDGTGEAQFRRSQEK